MRPTPRFRVPTPRLRVPIPPRILPPCSLRGCGPGVWQVAGDGSDEKVDYARIFPALRKAGYEGWVSFEYETPEPEESGIPRSLAYLKRMMA